jgi:hypothetical protein
MPLMAIILSTSQLVLAANSVAKFDVERTCPPAATVAGLPGRGFGSVPARRARCAQHSPEGLDSIQRNQTRCTGLVTTGGAPSYVELLTCLEMAKQARDARDKVQVRDGWPPLIASASRTQKSEGTRRYSRY